MTGWKPFDSAPKDGTEFLAAYRINGSGSDIYEVIRYNIEYVYFEVAWDQNEDNDWDFWMPIPPLP